MSKIEYSIDISEAFCSCGEEMIHNPDSQVLYCPRCINVYKIKTKFRKMKGEEISQELMEECEAHAKSLYETGE